MNQLYDVLDKYGLCFKTEPSQIDEHVFTRLFSDRFPSASFGRGILQINDLNKLVTSLNLDVVSCDLFVEKLHPLIIESLEFCLLKNDNHYSLYFLHHSIVMSFPTENFSVFLHHYSPEFELKKLFSPNRQLLEIELLADLEIYKDSMIRLLEKATIDPLISDLRRAFFPPTKSSEVL